MLLRALEPLHGLDRRTCGPGLLSKAMGVDRKQNGIDLCGETLFITQGDEEKFTIVRRPRIGVGYAGEWAMRPLRFYIRGNPHVSRP